MTFKNYEAGQMWIEVVQPMVKDLNSNQYYQIAKAVKNYIDDKDFMVEDSLIPLLDKIIFKINKWYKLFNS